MQYKNYKMTRFEGLEILKKHLLEPQHSILIGARQVGKTTVVKQLADAIQQQQQPVYFLTFEDSTILKAIDQHPENIFNFTKAPSTLQKKEKLYIVIDEVQYAANPTNFLKLLYDKYASKVKIIATGSSAFYIDKNFKDSLAGRKQVFELYPLDFEEFLHFKNQDKLIGELKEMRKRKKYQSLQQKKIDTLFEEYIIYGGYPAVVLASTEKRKKELLKELVNSYMKKDALEAGIKEELKFFQLAMLLASQVGSLVNQHELSNTLGLSVGTIDNYLYLLQKTFIVHLLSPKFGNLRKELTKMPKAYFNDTGLRNTLLNNFSKINDRMDKGELLENYVYTRLRKLYGLDALRYWRTADGNEVDFIIEQTLHKGKAFEIKYNDIQYKPSKYKKFMQHYKAYPLSVISKEKNNAKTIEAIRF